MSKIFTFRYVFLGILLTMISVANAMNTAPDASKSGPYKVNSAEYRLPPATDPDVLTDRVTEIWGKIFYPENSKNKTSPLVIMLHGNHSTCGQGTNPREDNNCQYTEKGSCPKGYVVTPNHQGYDYLAKNLASWGFIVASINANRGITCGFGVNGDIGLNLARGRLVLKHLSLLYQWSKFGNAPITEGDAQLLQGKINFSSVGLLGHSRGGEGVRAAYNIFSDENSPWPVKIPGLNIKAIFEIGAVDGQTSRVLDANGVAWNQLLPMCDGDVSELDGRYPYERMLLNRSEKGNSQKSLFEVWGANHNFFNTEWQENESVGCLMGSPIFDNNKSYSLRQQKIALISVTAFFRSWLDSSNASNKNLNENFNPLYSLPDAVTQVTQVDRDFTPSSSEADSLIMDDFDKATGINSSGNKNINKKITVLHQTVGGNKQQVALITWDYANSETYFEAVWAGAGQGRDVSGYATLDMRVGRSLQYKDADADGLKPIDFSIALEDAQGLISKLIPISRYAVINGPGNENFILKTVRIPISDFQGIDLTKVHGLRFIFNKTQSDAIYLANLRIQKQWGMGVDQQTHSNNKPNSLAVLMHAKAQQRIIQYVAKPLNKITRIHRLNKTLAYSGKSGVEITFTSQMPFLVLDSLPVLKIGSKTFKLSRYTDLQHLKSITFTLTEKQYKDVSQSADVDIINGKVWKFSSLAKAFK